MDTHTELANQVRDYLVGFWGYYQNNPDIQKNLTGQRF